MDAINIVLLVFVIGCAIIDTVLLTQTIKTVQSIDAWKLNYEAIRFLVNMLYAAIVFVWFIVGYSVLNCLQVRENEVVDLHDPFAAPIFLFSFGCGALRSKVTLGDSELANYLQTFKKFLTFSGQFVIIIMQQF